MDTTALSAIIVALITTVGTVLVALFNTLRKENRQDHNVVRQKLEELRQDVKDVDHKLDDHIGWHLDDK
jgi:Na+-translocating ferredoxin:NAD+ oxidoreductase RnfG subunit